MLGMAVSGPNGKPVADTISNPAHRFVVGFGRSVKSHAQAIIAIERIKAASMTKNFG